MVSSAIYSIPQKLPYHIILFDIYKEMVDAKDRGDFDYALERARSLFDSLRETMLKEVKDPDEIYLGYIKQLSESPSGIRDPARHLAKQETLHAKAVRLTIRTFARQCIKAFDKARMLDLYSKEMFFGEEKL